MTEEDRRLTRLAVLGMYRAANLPEPKHVVFVASPLVLAFASSFAAGIWYLRKNPGFLQKLCSSSATRDATRAATSAAKNSVEVNQLSRFLLSCFSGYYNLWNGGNQWSPWCAFISFFRHIAKLPIDYSAWDHYEVAALHSGPRAMTPDFCMVSDRPEFIRINSRNQPHCETGPFCRWRDGWELYYLNGVRMQKRQVMTPAEQLDPREILAETNVEVRRELLRKIGIERFLAVTQTKVLDTMGSYELLSVNLSEDVPDARYLKMTNPSIGVFHVEGVDPACDTVQKAINWRCGGEEEEWQPAQLT